MRRRQDQPVGYAAPAELPPTENATSYYGPPVELPPTAAMPLPLPKYAGRDPSRPMSELPDTPSTAPFTGVHEL